MFGRNKTNRHTIADAGKRLPDFSYLGNDEIYLDAACQSLRPSPVIDSLREYYESYNACGGRVKYDWGRKVDEAVEDTRYSVLGLLGASSKEYSASFTLNTTLGINLLLQQLPEGKYSRIVTSDIEHNSVFLPTMTAAKRLGLERIILNRTPTGALDYTPGQLDRAVVVVNAVSNIDGRQCANLKEIIKDTHRSGGIVIVDAAQAMAHHPEIIRSSGADGICFSAHKMYGASLGVIVAKKELTDILSYTIIGGGMVSSVSESAFVMTPGDQASRLEPGLQAWGEIIALGEAIKWLKTVEPGGMERHAYIEQLSGELFTGLTSIPGVTVINDQHSPVISMFSRSTDAHQLAIYLSEAGIMTRSGYFCCHYYLKEKLKLPPLLRFSLGLHNTTEDINKALDALRVLTGKG